MTDLVEALRSFVRVCEMPSFTAVAAETHTSHTTIARRIDFLEARFGVKLLQRTTRRILPTDEGEELLQRARSIIDDIEAAEQDLASRDRGPSGLVRIGVTTALGGHYAARLAGLHRLHPALRIEFTVSDWARRLDQAGLDLALCVGEVEDAALAVHPLGRFPRLLVAAPGYIAAHGAPATADALRAHQCIAYGYGPSRPVWHLDGRDHPVEGCFKADSSEAVFQAVLCGLGIGLLPHLRVAGDLAAGRLVQVLPDARVPALAISAVHTAGRRLPARVRAVLDFLMAEFP